MTILVVTHYYSTHAGGIEIVAGALAGHLAKTHDVVWAASDCDPLPAVAQGVRLLPMRSINTVERLTGLPFPLWGPGSLVRLWRASVRADVVHLHDVIYFGNWAAFLFARLHGIPVVVTQHAGLIRYPSAVLRAVLRMLHRTVARLLLSRATAVAFVSAVPRTYFARFVRFAREPALIQNGVDTDLYSPGTPAERAQGRTELGLDPEEPVVLFVGRFVETKGLRTIEKLAKRLPDVTFALAGWGPIDPRGWNMRNVRVFGSLRGATLVPLYRAANLLVLPSLGEGLPLVVQESLACGTPALVESDTATAIAAPGDAVYAASTAGADVADVWASAIRSRLADTAGASRRDAIARFARDEWSWPATAARYVDLFRTAASTRRQEPSPAP
jgi:glycosyltransferase involved in cell wall biosynthesis